MAENPTICKQTAIPTKAFGWVVLLLTLAILYLFVPGGGESLHLLLAS